MWMCSAHPSNVHVTYVLRGLSAAALCELSKTLGFPLIEAFDEPDDPRRPP